MASNPGLVEDQLLLRIQDPELTARLNALLSQGHFGEHSMQIEMNSANEGRFRFDSRELPATLVDLPCVVESHKSPDNITTYKSSDVHQMLIVQSEVQKTKDPVPLRYPHGITPPTQKIRPKRFERVKKLQPPHVRRYEKILKRIEHSRTSGAPAVSVSYDIVDVEEEYTVPADEAGAMVGEEFPEHPPPPVPLESSQEIPSSRPESSSSQTPLGLEAQRDVLETPLRAPEEADHLTAPQGEEDRQLEPESDALRPPSGLMSSAGMFVPTSHSPSRLASPDHMFGNLLDPSGLDSMDRQEHTLSPIARPDSIREDAPIRMSSIPRGFPSSMGTPARVEPSSDATPLEWSSAASAERLPHTTFSETRPLSEDVKQPSTPLFESQEQRSLEHPGAFRSSFTPGLTPGRERSDSPAPKPLPTTPSAVSLESPARNLIPEVRPEQATPAPPEASVPEPVEDTPEIAAARKELEVAVAKEEKAKTHLATINSALLKKRHQRTVDAAAKQRKAAEDALAKLLNA